MTIRYPTDKDGFRNGKAQLITCPACGDELDPHGIGKIQHIMRHDPEDFGLTRSWDEVEGLPDPD
jgi:hypothetical protein